MNRWTFPHSTPRTRWTRLSARRSSWPHSTSQGRSTRRRPIPRGRSPVWPGQRSHPYRDHPQPHSNRWIVHLRGPGNRTVLPWGYLLEFETCWHSIILFWSTVCYSSNRLNRGLQQWQRVTKFTDIKRHSHGTRTMTSTVTARAPPTSPDQSLPAWRTATHHPHLPIPPGECFMFIILNWSYSFLNGRDITTFHLKQYFAVQSSITEEATAAAAARARLTSLGTDGHASSANGTNAKGRFQWMVNSL